MKTLILHLFVAIGVAAALFTGDASADPTDLASSRQAVSAEAQRLRDGAQPALTDLALRAERELTASLGSSCDARFLRDGLGAIDPRALTVRCGADQLFGTGMWTVSPGWSARLATLGTELARLGTLLGPRMEVSVAGLVDRQSVRPELHQEDFDPCPDLRSQLSHDETQFSSFTLEASLANPDAQSPARRWANVQLSACRAAQVLLDLRGGSARSPGADGSAVRWTAIGLGTQWADLVGRCHSADCRVARRVEVYVRFAGLVQAAPSQCALDTNRAGESLRVLACFEDAILRSRRMHLPSEASAFPLCVSQGRAMGPSQIELGDCAGESSPQLIDQVIQSRWP